MMLNKLINQAAALPWVADYEDTTERGAQIKSFDLRGVANINPEDARLAVLAVNNLPALVDAIQEAISCCGDYNIAVKCGELLAKLDKESGE